MRCQARVAVFVRAMRAPCAHLVGRMPRPSLFDGRGVRPTLVAAVAIACAMPLVACAAASPDVLYVSPSGNDAWSGKLAAANAAKSDGPLASLVAARDAIRKLKAAGPLTAPVEVRLRGGIYRPQEMLTFEPQDSGTAAVPHLLCRLPRRDARRQRRRAHHRLQALAGADRVCGPAGKPASGHLLPLAVRRWRADDPRALSQLRPHRPLPQGVSVHPSRLLRRGRRRDAQPRRLAGVGLRGAGGRRVHRLGAVRARDEATGPRATWPGRRVSRSMAGPRWC